MDTRKEWHWKDWQEELLWNGPHQEERKEEDLSLIHI